MGTVHDYRPSDGISFEGEAERVIRALNQRLVHDSALLSRLGKDLKREKFVLMRAAHQRLLQRCLAVDKAMNSVVLSQGFIVKEIPLNEDFELASANDNRDIEVVFSCRRRGAVVYVYDMYFNDLKLFRNQARRFAYA